MADRFPDLVNGDLATGLSEAEILTLKSTVASTKGDIVSMGTANPSGDFGDYQLAGVYSVAAAPTTANSCVGVITETQSGGTTFASGDYAPVVVRGVMKLTASAAAIPAGTHVVVAASATGAFTIQRLPALAAADADHRYLLDEVLGWAIQDFGASDNGLVMVGKP